VQLHVVDPSAFRPFRTGLACVARAREQDLRAFRWRTEPYEFVEGIPAFDLLCGSAREREAIEAGAEPGALGAHLRAEERSFSARRAAYLAYGP
jgi:uncharacterized protein YbbC (DUF1343 family)